MPRDGTAGQAQRVAALIALASDEGQRLLAEAGRQAGHAMLMRHFEPQRHATYCGVASAVMVLNALRPVGPHLDQESFFRQDPTPLRSAWRVRFHGMPLAEFARRLASHGADASLHYAAVGSIDAFRSIVQHDPGTPSELVVVNYQRALLGQPRMGHISPLSAYHAASDRLLVLDVAADRHPPCWVPLADLWRAMALIERPGHPGRGYVVVHGQRERSP